MLSGVRAASRGSARPRATGPGPDWPRPAGAAPPPHRQCQLCELAGLRRRRARELGWGASGSLGLGCEHMSGLGRGRTCADTAAVARAREGADAALPGGPRRARGGGSARIQSSEPGAPPRSGVWAECSTAALRPVSARPPHPGRASHGEVELGCSCGRIVPERWADLWPALGPGGVLLRGVPGTRWAFPREAQDKGISCGRAWGGGGRRQCHIPTALSCPRRAKLESRQMWRPSVTCPGTPCAAGRLLAGLRARHVEHGRAAAAGRRR